MTDEERALLAVIGIALVALLERTSVDDNPKETAKVVKYLETGVLRVTEGVGLPKIKE